VLRENAANAGFLLPGGKMILADAENPLQNGGLLHRIFQQVPLSLIRARKHHLPAGYARRPPETGNQYGPPCASKLDPHARFAPRSTSALMVALIVLVGALALCIDRGYNGDFYMSLLGGRFVSSHGFRHP